MHAHRHLPALAAFGSLVSLQVGAAFAKTVYPLVGPEGVAALRTGIAALILGLAFRPWRLSLARSQWPALLAYGAMIGAMNLLIYRSFAYIPIGIAISIEVLGPLAVAMLASRRPVDLLWIALALAGLALLPLGSATGALDWRGVAFALAAGAGWAVYIAVGARVAPLGQRGVAAGMALASLMVLPFGIGHAGTALLEPRILAFGLVVAILSSTLPFMLDIYALRHLPQRIFGILMSASPAVSAIAGLLVLGERLSVLQWIGIASITLACLGATLMSPNARQDS